MTTEKETEMKLSQMYPSRFLKADDLDGPTLDVIEKVGQDQVGREQEVKPIVYFRKLKPLVLNKTNAQTIVAIAGTDETDNWGGVAVEVYPTTTPFGTEIVDCVRLRAPGTGPRPRK